MSKVKITVRATFMQNGISNSSIGSVNFRFKGCCSNFNKTLCKQTVETLIRRRVLFCLHMSHEKDARLIYCSYTFVLKGIQFSAVRNFNSTEQEVL